MSKLDELINDLCPDEVEYKMLGIVSNIYDGTHSTPKYTLSGVKFVSVQNINSLYESNKFISQEDYDKFKIKPKYGDVLMTRIGDVGTATVVDSDEPIAYYVSLALIRTDKTVNPYYLKYYINSKYFKKELNKRIIHTAVPIKINLGEIGKCYIALPPLPVQEEIVRILDKSTELTAELNENLTAELTARKQQYEYYRDSLLTFGDDVEYKPFGEIATIFRGASPRPIKNFITGSKDGISWIKIGDVKTGNKYVEQTKEKITEVGAKKSRFVKKGDFILSNSMSFGRPYILNIDGCIHDGWLSISCFENDFTSDFLYHLLSSHKLQEEMKKRASFGGAVQNLNADIVKALLLPIPPLNEQQHIAEILDRFDKLCNDISEGLPAEIKARQQQYEYYRDKLLSFKEKEVC